MDSGTLKVITKKNIDHQTTSSKCLVVSNQTDMDKTKGTWNKGVTKRCRLPWLTNSALVYEPKCGGGGLRGLSQ